MARRRFQKGLSHYVPFWLAPVLAIVVAPLYLHSVVAKGFPEAVNENIFWVSALLFATLASSVLGCVLDAACDCPRSFPGMVLAVQLMLTSGVVILNFVTFLPTRTGATSPITQDVAPAGLPTAHGSLHGISKIALQKKTLEVKDLHEKARTPSGVRRYIVDPKPPPDHRAPECKAEHERLKTLPKGTLPNTSVIFTFCNEPEWSLMNSIHSVIARSPRHLLHEIVLVSDGSDAPHLQKPLEDQVKDLPVPVRIVRTKHQGLMRARVAGARVATGETITILDSHVSCSIGWLESLMYRISQGRDHVVMPIIDGIDRAWNYKPGGVELVGYNTHLVDHGIRLQKAHDFPGRQATDPQPSPAMAGGLFSIHREYFWEIGAFDEGMLHWGGENIEIGFRVWQCGGRIELISCSRVGHLWGGMGANCPWTGSAPGTMNKWRAIEVWMDPPHQEMMRDFLPYPEGGTGDLTAMKNLRDKLKCKGFDYFLEHAYPECWMTVLQNAILLGVLRNVATKQCIDPRASGGVRMVECNLRKRQGNPQFLRVTAGFELLCNEYNGDIDQCIEAGFGERAKLSVYGCHGQKGNQEWSYMKSTKMLKHGPACLQADAEGDVFVEPCKERLEDSRLPNPAQQWEWVTPSS
eukprot:TRINITY_DN103715_c0_g1_i1.p1 TRINITY_DN103715_c0_g1~~TRINITY_DN103715_c0_g1_i1.p1  ORF type:complete len:636 (+),score=76.89 TRINITY_DN103715_c0_g1_i1:163-2070(+)